MSALDTMRCLSKGGAEKELQCELDKGHSCFHKNGGVTWEDDIYDAVAQFRENHNLSEPEPPPVPNKSAPIAELVIQDLKDRMQFGLTKYGMLLQANNGRNAGVDAYQEQLDHLIYFRQLIEERFLLLVAIAAELHAAGFTLPEATTTKDPEILFRNILRAIEEARRFRAAHGALIRERDGEVWIWSTGDPEDGDNLDTINCPILIQPYTLREIVRQGKADLQLARDISQARDTLAEAMAIPVPMIIFCPKCQKQHIDREETDQEFNARITAVKDSSSFVKLTRWTNPPHKTHRCLFCGIDFRFSSIYTVGVETIPPGPNDTWRPDQDRWMLEIGVEGDKFHLHKFDDQCPEAGCVPAVNSLPVGTTFQQQAIKEGGERPAPHAIVYIWSAEHGTWWRSNASGYTVDIKEAGLYVFSDAWQRSNHAGPEKKLAYIIAEI